MRVWLGVLAVWGGLVPAALAADAVQALVPWSSRGHVYEVAEGHLLFVGEFTGIVYVGEAVGQLDTSLVTCPATMEFQPRTRTRVGQGRCIITDGDGHKIFAAWQCAGDPKLCRGELRLVGGTGKFQGIQGGSPLVLRTALMQLGQVAGEEAPGAPGRGAGLAILPALRYDIQGATQ
jgi:hypothetical protein